jgi:hypothetical protein
VRTELRAMAWNLPVCPVLSVPALRFECFFLQLLVWVAGVGLVVLAAGVAEMLTKSSRQLQTRAARPQQQTV